MTTAQTRESRSVRLSQDEWDLAEAISIVSLGNTAGHGLRTALELAGSALRDSNQGAELDEQLTLIRERRAMQQRIREQRTAGGDR